MAIERERKFLVKNLPSNFTKDQSDKIVQVYLALTDTTQFRLRVVNFINAFVCYKQTISPTDKLEFEYEVNCNDALNTISDPSNYDCYLSKNRIKYNGWDIDIYPNGLTVAEYEYSDENPFPDILPDWIGEEITGRKEYSNIYIAKNFDKFK